MTGPSEQEGQPAPFEPMPSAPPPLDPEPAPVAVARPKPVENAFLLWLVGAALYLISNIIGAFGDSTQEALERQLGRAPTDAEISTARIFGLVIGVVMIGLFVLFAYLMRTGKNWARIVLTVLGALSVVLNLIGIGSAGALNMIFSLAVSVLVVVAIYFMYRPESNQYFTAARPKY